MKYILSCTFTNFKPTFRIRKEKNNFSMSYFVFTISIKLSHENTLKLSFFLQFNSCAKQMSLSPGGHDNSSTNSLPTTFLLDLTTGEWTESTPMTTPRRDHACLFVDFEDRSGVLVTGGTYQLMIQKFNGSY